MTHVLIITAVWDGSTPPEIVAVFNAANLSLAFTRLRELNEWGHPDHEGARFVIDLHEVL